MRVAVRDLTRMLVVPHGFTLSIAGTLAATVADRGGAGVMDVWLFVLGAGLGFCALAAVSGAATSRPGRRASEPPAATGAVVFNLAPLAVVPGAGLGSSWTASHGLGFLLAGLIATIAYVALLGLVVAITARPAVHTAPARR